MTKEEKKESRCYRCGETAILICDGCKECLGMNDAQNEWIDVNDRLPKEGVNVMAYTVSEFYEVMHYEDGYWIDLDFTMIKPIYVTHWQPLPKPPKKD